MPSGYGHKKVTIEYFNGKHYSAVTNNMPCFDAYNSEVITRKDETTQKAAEKQLIRFVKDANGLK